MTSISVSTTTQLYDIQKKLHIQSIPVVHQSFREFSYQLSRFIQSTKELSDEEFWSAPLRALKRYRFEMSVAPLGFGNPAIISPEVLKKLEYAVEDCGHYYPTYASNFNRLVESLKELVIKNENPYFERIKELLEQQPQIALALKESRHISLTEEILKLNEIEDAVTIVSESQLKKPDVFFPAVLCLGASRWFADYVFRAPRTENMFVMRFSWIGDTNSKAKPIFSGSKNIDRILKERNPTRTKRNPLANYSDTSTPQVEFNDNWLIDEELIPSLDLSNVSKKFSTDSGYGVDEADQVQARLFQLEGRRGVFLEAEDSSTSLIIDLDDDEINRVHRSTTNHIQAGMFILLRADEGEGNDYIIPVADKILGKKAERYRNVQKSWKEKFRQAVKHRGMNAAISLMRQYGSIRAGDINIRNWCSDKNIRPADFRDYLAIMRFIGVEEIAETCWNYAAEIDKAHMMAGSRIRRQLLRQVLKSDLHLLEQRGEMRFELAEIGCKPLLALRVVRRSEQSVSIASNLVNKLFELEDDKWRG